MEEHFSLSKWWKESPLSLLFERPKREITSKDESVGALTHCHEAYTNIDTGSVEAKDADRRLGEDCRYTGSQGDTGMQGYVGIQGDTGIAGYAVQGDTGCCLRDSDPNESDSVRSTRRLGEILKQQNLYEKGLINGEELRKAYEAKLQAQAEINNPLSSNLLAKLLGGQV